MLNSSSLIVEVECLVRDHMAQYDPSHDMAHVERVRKMALAIAHTIPGIDLVVVELAALLHDLTDSKYSDGRSLELLTSHLFEDCPDVSFAQLELVYRIVPSVSFSTEKALKAAGQWLEWHQTCPELHAVQDADRLDAMGAVGILRCAAFSGVRGRYLVEEQPGAGPGCEGHFYTKLLTLKLMMKTDAGLREAEKRHQTMLNFLEALNEERAMVHSR